MKSTACRKHAKAMYDHTVRAFFMQSMYEYMYDLILFFISNVMGEMGYTHARTMSTRGVARELGEGRGISH